MGGITSTKVTDALPPLSRAGFFFPSSCFFGSRCFLMPPMILLQQAELWELRAGLGANRAWRVVRFRHGQVCRCVQWHSKTPRYDSLHTGWGHAVSHTEGLHEGGGDMKDEETVKCEHGMDVFEVSPPAPPRPHSHHHNHSPNHANFPLPPPSCSIPSGWLHHALLAGGLSGVQ